MLRRALPRSGPILVALLCAQSLPAFAIDSSLTYQGHLTDSTLSGPASGSYDLQFTLQDTGGTTVGVPILIDNASVVGGVFTVQLDFGPTAFTGPDRFLQIGVRRGSETGGFTVLNPRSAITPAPYAQTSTTAGFAATVANNSIGSAQIADGTVNAADIDGSMQRRVAGTCASGSAIAAISASGTVTCEASAASGAGSIVPFASGAGNFSVSAPAPGVEGTGLMVGFGGADQTNGQLSSGTIDITNDGNLAFVVPRNATLTSVSFHVSTNGISNLGDATVVLLARVYRATGGSNSFSPIAGSTVGAIPPLTGGAGLSGTTAEGTLSGLSIPVAAGDRLLFVVGAQSDSDPFTVGVRVSGGLGIQ